MTPCGKTIRGDFCPKRTSQNGTIRQVSVHNFSVRDSIQHFFYYWLRTKYTTVNFFIFSTMFISQDVLNLMSIDLQFSMLVCPYVIHPPPHFVSPNISWFINDLKRINNNSYIRRIKPTPLTDSQQLPIKFV